MTFGDVVLKISTGLAVVAFVAAFRWARGNAASERTFRWAYHGMTAGLALASAALMVALLTHDFRFHYVIGYSSRDLPLLYLISAFWAGQQGTYLLWALFAALVGYALFTRRSWEPAAVMTAYLPTLGYLFALMLDPEGGNPFYLASQVPPDGRGLNPLLQDPWMASHPPVVFLGYAAMAVPAVLALVALLKREEDPWVGPALRWGLLGFISLGVGIILGGFWAYKVLGWGGYWGWDPVENASLTPWIVVAALIHGLLIQRATGAMRVINLTLALAGYVLVLYATFLTRSGVLADFSVHSFPSGSIYRILVAILALTVAVAGVALVRRRGPQSSPVEPEMSWPFVVTTAIALLGISAAFVLIGTSWPILSSMVGKASSLGPSFYNRVSLPIYVALLGLLALAPLLGWGRVPLRRWAVRLAPGVIVGIVGTTAAAKLSGGGAGALSLFFVALAALTSNVVRLVEVARGRWLHTGAAVAHMGFALMFVGIVASSAWGSARRAVLPLGEPVEVLGRTVTYRGHVAGSGPQDRWALEIRAPGEPMLETAVTLFRTGPGEGDIIRRPAIVRGLAGDLYVAPQGIDEAGPGDATRVELSRGQGVPFGHATLTFERFETRGMGSGEGMTVLAHVRVDHGDRSETVALPFGTSGETMRGEPVAVDLLHGARMTLEGMAVEQGRILVGIESPGSAGTETLYAEVSTKPLIGLLWTGTVLLVAGCGVAVARRVIEEPAAQRVEPAAARRSGPRAARKQRRGVAARGRSRGVPRQA